MGLLAIAGFMLCSFLPIYLRDFATGKEQEIASYATGKHFEARLAHVLGAIFAPINIVMGLVILRIPDAHVCGRGGGAGAGGLAHAHRFHCRGIARPAACAGSPGRGRHRTQRRLVRRVDAGRSGGGVAMTLPTAQRFPRAGFWALHALVIPAVFGAGIAVGIFHTTGHGGHDGHEVHGEARRHSPTAQSATR